MSGMDGLSAHIAVSQLNADNASQNARDGAERQRQTLVPHSRLDALLSPKLADATPPDFHGMSELTAPAEGLASIQSAIEQVLHQIDDARTIEQVVQDAAKDQAEAVDPLLESVQAYADMMAALRSPWL